MSFRTQTLGCIFASEVSAMPIVTAGVKEPKPPRPVRPDRVPHGSFVVEWLKKGPLTAALVPQVKRLDCVIVELREKGWPITTTLENFYDGTGREYQRAVYRMGNWLNLPLPLQGGYLRRNVASGYDTSRVLTRERT